MTKHYKEATEHKQIELIPAPDELIVPLLQHIGAPADLKVEKGQKIYKGTILGESEAFVSAKVHSPVSGEVADIITTMYPYTAKMVTTVKIANDKQDEIDPSIKPYPELGKLEPADIIEAVKNAGLVGMGGATFPTHIKLSPPPEKKIDTVILNAAECEPYLTADHRVLLEETDDVVHGLEAVKKAVGAKNVIIGIENNKMDAVEKLKNTNKSNLFDIKILPSKYPTGAEKVLVKKTTGKKVPLTGIPLDVGVLVINVGTVAQISKTLRTGLPLIDRVMTVSGEGFSNPGNYRVSIGTTFEEIVKLNIAEQDFNKYSLILGGPMMGFAVSNLKYPVIKGSSGILLIKAQVHEESPCIRCGKCINVCTLGLVPHEHQSESCMECGLCAFYCPANRKLSQRAKVLKTQKKKG